MLETKGDDYDKTFQFRHPFTMSVIGPTSCGKTYWVKSLLEHANKMITPSPYKIIWIYKRWQPMYTDIEANIPNIEFIRGIPANINDDDFTDTSQPTLLIFDDMMRSSSNNEDISELYTEGSHHRNLSIISLLQNLFNKGKESRTISLNNHYLTLFKNPRDMQQISVLARQMYPGNNQVFMNKFKEATSKPYGTLLVDLKPDTLDKDRLQTRITWPHQEEVKEHSIEPPPNKRIKIEDDTNVFLDWIKDIIKTHDMLWKKQVEILKQEGMNQSEAEQNAETDFDDQKAFYEKYQTLLKEIIPLEQSILHHMIINNIEDLLENGLSITKAIKYALKHHQSQFDKIFQKVDT